RSISFTKVLLRQCTSTCPRLKNVCRPARLLQCPQGNQRAAGTSEPISQTAPDFSTRIVWALAQILSGGVGLYSKPLKRSSGQSDLSVALQMFPSFMKKRIVRSFGVLVWSTSSARRHTGGCPLCAQAESATATRTREKTGYLSMYASRLRWIVRVLVGLAIRPGRNIVRIRNGRLVFER